MLLIAEWAKVDGCTEQEAMVPNFERYFETEQKREHQSYPQTNQFEEDLDTYQVLKLFQQERIEDMAAFVDDAVSAVRGRPGFETCMRKFLSNQRGNTGLLQLVTPSDLAFCLTTLENNWEFWVELAKAKYFNRAPSATIRPKLSTGREKKSTNGSLELQNKYQDYLEMVNASIKDLKLVPQEWVAYENLLIGAMQQRKKDWGEVKDKQSKKVRKRKRDLEEQNEWI